MIEHRLHIYSRSGDIVKAEFRPDQLAFQIGESAEILSAGYLQATPHSVRGSTSLSCVSRETFAVFLQPSYFYNLNYPSNTQVKEQFSSALNIPRISSRFQNGDTFATFARNTTSQYYWTAFCNLQVNDMDRNETYNVRNNKVHVNDGYKCDSERIKGLYAHLIHYYIVNWRLRS